MSDLKIFTNNNDMPTIEDEIYERALSEFDCLVKDFRNRFGLEHIKYTKDQESRLKFAAFNLADTVMLIINEQCEDQIKRRRNKEI